jgi:alkylation response protein AidB-like acyl-CoA dehydrogenase
MRNKDGKLNGIQVQKLKNKLGTRQLPTAELLLDGVTAHKVLFIYSALFLQSIISSCNFFICLHKILSVFRYLMKEEVFLVSLRC